jgi:hypothetical protein
MPRPVTDLEYEFDVQFVEISEDADLDRRAGIFLLLQWIKEARNFEVLPCEFLETKVPYVEE